MKRYASFALCALILGALGSAYAQVQCSVPAGATLSFGTYDDSLALDLDVSVALSVECCRTSGGTQTATVGVGIGPSTHSGLITTRQLRNAADGTLMNYQLYYGSFGGTVWGDGLSGGSLYNEVVTVNRPCNKPAAIPLTSPIFGRVFQLQPVTPGTYTDSLTITVNP